MATIKGFGERVAQARREKAARERRDILKKDVAETLGVSESTVGRWERGTLPEEPEMLRALADYLAVTPAWLHYGVGSPEAIPSDTRPPAYPVREPAPAEHGARSIARHGARKR